MAGYIKIHRKLLSCGWYSCPCVKDVFLHLLLTANFTPSEFRGVMIERGQAVFGLDSLSKALGYSIQQIRTAINKLKKTGEITVQSPTRHFSVATIHHYSLYQDIEEQSADNKQITNNQQTDNKQITNNQQTDNTIIRREEGKEGKEGKKEYTSVIGDFNRICQNLPNVKAINPTRKGRIDRAAEILRRYGASFEELFARAEASDFLTGRVKDWRANFDWILKPENLTKILEGCYDNRTVQANKGKGSVYSTAGASFDVSKYENSGMFDD